MMNLRKTATSLLNKRKDDMDIFKTQRYLPSFDLDPSQETHVAGNLKTDDVPILHRQQKSTSDVIGGHPAFHLLTNQRVSASVTFLLPADYLWADVFPTAIWSRDCLYSI
jgi:hypothetical protein